MSIRTRFAPSPTGVLHIGGVRTALYSWLYARKNQGEFFLRIEDTDSERSTEDSMNAILEGMRWLGLDYDDRVYRQTENYDRYKSILNNWLEEGKAYRCYCSRDRLDALRQSQLENKQKPKYDGHCRDKSLPHRDEAYVLRFKNPEQGEVVFDDLVYGPISVKNSELDDLIIQRSDGHPTYNFTVVVDDYDMKISHVIRGDDHINNTPRQINMLKALDATLPIYAHLPMILGEDGKRLSKRHGAVGVEEFRQQGFLKEALLNYLVRLGWSHGDQEIFSKAEMIELFNFKSVGRGSATFNHEKLLWLNQHYLKTLPLDKLIPLFKGFLAIEGVDTGSDEWLGQILRLQADRFKTLVEMAKNSLYFFKAPKEFDEKAKTKFLTSENLPALEAVYQRFKQCNDWQATNIMPMLEQVAKDLDLKLGKVAPSVRVAVTGGTNSASLDAVLALVGKEQTLNRLAVVVDVESSQNLLDTVRPSR